MVYMKSSLLVALFKISPTTSVIKEPNRQEVRVQNSEIAKFGTKAERDTDLGSQGQTPKPPQTKVNQIDNTAEKSDDEESVNYITSYQQLYEQVYDSNYDSDSENYVAAISCDSAHQLEPLNAKIQFSEVQVNAMIDSGSVVTLITKTLANRILRTSPSAK